MIQFYNNIISILKALINKKEIKNQKHAKCSTVLVIKYVDKQEMSFFLKIYESILN